jgi:hypothetical protein
MKHTNDVRALSANAAYMGVVFSGSMKNAIKQAKAAPDHGLATQYVPKGMSRNRAVLLQHLNLLKAPVITEVTPDLSQLSKYSLDYAIARGWIIRVQP